MDKTRKKLVVAGAAGAVGTFLPWASLGPLISVDGTAGDGWISLALFVLAIVAATRGDRTKPLTGKQRVWATVFGVGGGAVVLLDLVHIKSQFSDRGGLLAGAVTVGPGLYLIVGAGAAVAAVAFFGGRSSAA